MKAILFVATIGLLMLLAACSVSDNTSTSQLGDISLYKADYRLTPDQHLLETEILLTWHPAEIDTFFFLLNKNLEIGMAHASGDVAQGELLVLAEGEQIPIRLHQHIKDADAVYYEDHHTLYALPITTDSDSIEIMLSYRGEIFDDVSVPEFSRWELADETTGLISEQGAFLVPSTGYYPVIPCESGLSRFETTIHTPVDWKGLAEGNIDSYSESRTTFFSKYPLDGSNLVAGPYILDTLMSDSIEIAMYHYEDDEELVQRYLSHSARYIAMYQEMIGPYPFERFSVVENWFPTGYGMPSYTLLGTEVLRLPFIVYTSLGHEILHNWWGNGVLVDHDSGNWCEGLTVYQADYNFAGSRNPTGKRQYRLDALRDYSDYVIRGEDEDFPLREFTSRTSAGSRTIGYGKAMMVFHMAALRIGEDVFKQALSDLYNERQFEKTAWRDFFDEFESVSGEDFGWYERQWIDRDGAPSFEVSNPLVQHKPESSNYLLEFDLEQVQDGDTFRMDIPVRLYFENDSSSVSVLHDVNKEMYHARVQTNARPERFAIDPEYNVFRSLDPLEAPPTFSGFYGAEQLAVILPPPDDPMRDAYQQLAESLLSRSEPTFIEPDDLSEHDLTGLSILRFGRKNLSQRVLNTPGLQDSPADENDLALIWASRNSEQPDVVHMDIWAANPGALAPLARKLPHYGKYSYLAFNAGRNVAKGQWEVTDSPLSVELPRP